MSETQAPSLKEWRAFMTRSAAALAAGALLAAVVCFVAYNWGRMGPSLKLYLMDAVILVALALALRLGLDRWQGRLAVFAAFFLVGPLFAIFGQAYPSGAPLSDLLFTWSAISALGALLLGGDGLWLLAIATLNGAFYAWAPLGRGWWGFGADGLKHMAVGLSDVAVWGLALAVPGWLSGTMSRRTLIFSGAFFLNVAFVLEFFQRSGGGLTTAVFMVFLGGLLAYAFIREQLFELVLVCLGGLSLVNCVMIKGMKWEGFLAITFVNLFIGGFAVMLLNHLHSEWKERS